MGILNKFIDHNKFGPGVSKENNESKLGRFFRILKSKFWKICSLNLILIGCLVPFIALSVGIYNMTPLSESNVAVEYLYSEGYNVDFINIVDKYIDAFQPSEKKLIELKASFTKLTEKIKATNPDFISEGSSEFDLSKYSEKDGKEILNLATNILDILSDERLEIKNINGKWSIVDTKSNDYALTSISFDDGDITIVDSIQGGYTDYFYWVLVLIPFAFIGPIMAGVIKVTRDFVREEPVFLFSDFIDGAKKNFFPSIAISFIQYIISAIVLNAIMLYYSYLGNGFIYTFAFAASLFLAFIFVAMNFYIMLMQVTLKLSLKKIFKNAFFFSIICLFRNILLLFGFIAVVLIYVVLFIVGQAYGLVLGFTMLSVLGFLIELMIYVMVSAVYPPIKRIVIDPYYEAHKEETSAAITDKDSSIEKTSESDTSTESEEETAESEYVYHNGRMVHRSALENDILFRD